jgi:hypothetical protein
MANMIPELVILLLSRLAEADEEESVRIIYASELS